MVAHYRPDRNRTILTTATLAWFDDGCCDVKYLDWWNDVSLNYTPGQAVDSGWRVDHRDLVIGHDATGELFQNAADRLMRYRYYPCHILQHTGDFDLGESRWLAVGDRIVQRVHLIRLFDRNILDVIGMVEVSKVVAEPRRFGFTYVTVATHVEQGEWTVEVSWQKDGTVILQMDAITRPVPDEPARNYRLMRWLQKRAHKQGMSHFKRSVLA